MIFRCIFTSLISVFIFTIPAFAEYTVVLKKNGKLIKGEYLREDEQYIYILSEGIQVNFKKSLLDLERMKGLNTFENKSVPKTDTDQPTKKDAEETPSSPLVTAAENARKNKTGKGKVFTDADRSNAQTDELVQKKEKEDKERPKSPEVAGYLQTIENLNKEIERLEQELMDAKLENNDTKAIEKLLEDTKTLRERRQSEYEEIINQQQQPER